MADDRRFLSHACLEPKVERDQDGLHLMILTEVKPLWGSPFRRPLGWRLSVTPSVSPIYFKWKKDRGGKKRGRERSIASMLLLRVRENMYNSSSSAVWGLGCIGVRHTAFIDDA